MRGCSACDWGSVFSVTGGKEKKSQEETWCKPGPLLLCVYMRDVLGMCQGLQCLWSLQ